MKMLISVLTVCLLVSSAFSDAAVDACGEDIRSAECENPCDGQDETSSDVNSNRMYAAKPNDDNCVGRCGKTFDSSKSCQCNDQCTEFDDCCSDYTSTCLSGAPDDNCVGRCGKTFDSSKSCQCNDQCTEFDDCCSDYTSTCLSGAPVGITDAQLKDLGDLLWDADHERFAPSDLILSITTSGRLFNYVNEEKLKNPSYALFIALLDNYNPINGEEEPPLTSEEKSETDEFLDHVLASDVMKIVQDVFIQSGKIKDEADMKETLYKMWFDFYKRSPKLEHDDSSGFEHVFVGEKKRTKVNGFHSWVQMYLLEKEGRIFYETYNAIQEPDLMDIKLDWDDLPKDRASMFIGTSPEFDMALYTLCALAKPGKECYTSIEGNRVGVKSYVTESEIQTVFPMVRTPK